jgi:hypothetical protein
MNTDLFTQVTISLLSLADTTTKSDVRRTTHNCRIRCRRALLSPSKAELIIQPFSRIAELEEWKPKRAIWRQVCN